MSFVQSGSELAAWIGLPPADWSTDWLKWAVSLSNERPTEAEAESLPYIANEDIESWTGKLLNPEPQPADADSRRFHADDVLFNKLRPYLAKVHHATFDGVSSGELLCLRPSERVLPRFLFYVTSSKAFIDAVNAETFGTKMPRADWGIVGHQPFPLPPLETQRRICAFLDEKTAQTDGLIAKKRTLLELLAEKRQAIIAQAVNKGLDPAAPTKDSGIDWLGEIPAHWDAVPLRRLASRVVTGRTPPATAGDVFTDGETPWFTPGDFDGLVLSQSEKHIIPKAFDEGVVTLYPPNSVLLVAIGATLGKVAVAPMQSSSNQQINSIFVRADTDPYYLAHYLHAIRAEVRMSASGNTLLILNQDKTKTIAVPRPPHDEQVKIADFLRMVGDRINEAAAKIRESISLLNERRGALISLAVTGQIAGLQ